MDISDCKRVKPGHSRGKTATLVVLNAMLLMLSGGVMAQPEAAGTRQNRGSPAASLAEAGPAGAHTTVLALDDTSACEPAKKSVCENLVQDNILWRISEPDNPASKHWLQENLDKLCACTTDAYATVNCFQVQVNNKGKTWQEAIAVCRASH